MLILGTRNTAIQDLAVGDFINFGEVYRRYDKRGACGNRAFELNGTSILLQHQGIYHITAVITFTAGATGDVTFQLLENGVATSGALVTESVGTADTEVRSISFPYLVLVDKACVCGVFGVVAKSLSLVNTGVPATITNVSIAITKVC